MRTPLQERSASSSDRMLGATAALLDRGGLAAVTVAAVAREAGTSNGSLYHRFGDRTGLLLATQDRLLAAIEAETVAAFERADAEPDDARAVRLLARAAVELYGAHRPALRAFLVEGREVEAFVARNTAWSHAVAATITGWLRGRLGASGADAEASYRIIHALGVTQALVDDAQVSPTPVTPGHLADALARAVLAITGRAPPPGA